MQHLKYIREVSRKFVFFLNEDVGLLPELKYITLERQNNTEDWPTATKEMPAGSGV